MSANEITHGILGALVVLVWIATAGSFIFHYPTWAAVLAVLAGVIAAIVYACGAFARSGVWVQRVWLMAGLTAGVGLLVFSSYLSASAGRDTGVSATAFWIGAIVSYLSGRLLWNTWQQADGTEPLPPPEHADAPSRSPVEPRPVASPLDVAPKR